jgi:DNA-binding GntR family transcriptional regulator
VPPVSGPDLREIASLRLLLECHALHESFAAGDMEWEGRVVAAHHKLFSIEKRVLAGSREDVELWKQYDWQFHQALISACGSRVLMEAHGGVFDKYLRYQMIALSNRGEISVREHRMMLDCALKRDAETVCKVLTAHIEGGLEVALASGTI